MYDSINCISALDFHCAAVDFCIVNCSAGFNSLSTALQDDGIFGNAFGFKLFIVLTACAVFDKFAHAAFADGLNAAGMDNCTVSITAFDGLFAAVIDLSVIRFCADGRFCFKDFGGKRPVVEDIFRALFNNRI